MAKYDLNLISESINDIEKAIQLDPENIRFLNHKGLLLCNSRRYKEAIEVYENVIKIDPQNTIALKCSEYIKDFLKTEENKINNFDNDLIERHFKDKYVINKHH